jgi:hypothetical protein
MDAIINEEVISGNRTVKRKDSSNLRSLFNVIYHKNKHNCFTSIIQDTNNISNLFNYLVDCTEKDKVIFQLI